MFDRTFRSSPFFHFMSIAQLFVLLVSFVVPSGVVHAQTFSVFNLPKPGTMVSTSEKFIPPLLKGISLHKENPLVFDFIIDPGNAQLSSDAVQTEGQKLIKYFLASLTIPEEDLWVNLSPYEENRIVPDEFGKTEMGRDLLAQDYILKQLSASLIYPEKDLGKSFWDRVYQKAQAKYGTTDIPMTTFNKVWIIPDKAVILETDDTAYVVRSRLKVLMEQDYIALDKNRADEVLGTNHLSEKDVNQVSSISSEVVREIIIPEIEREINEGQNFSQLRQIYSALILAYWFKDNLKNNIVNEVYSNQAKISGVDVEDKTDKEKIYQHYLSAYRQGVFNYIKEDLEPTSGEAIPRKYFSGGFNGNRSATGDPIETIDGRGGSQAAETALETAGVDPKAATEAVVEGKSLVNVTVALDTPETTPNLIDVLEERIGKLLKELATAEEAQGVILDPEIRDQFAAIIAKRLENNFPALEEINQFADELKGISGGLVNELFLPEDVVVDGVNWGKGRDLYPLLLKFMETIIKSKLTSLAVEQTTGKIDINKAVRVTDNDPSNNGAEVSVVFYPFGAFPTQTIAHGTIPLMVWLDSLADRVVISSTEDDYRKPIQMLTTLLRRLSGEHSLKANYGDLFRMLVKSGNGEARVSELVRLNKNVRRMRIEYVHGNDHAQTWFRDKEGKIVFVTMDTNTLPEYRHFLEFSDAYKKLISLTLLRNQQIVEENGGDINKGFIRGEHIQLLEFLRNEQTDLLVYIAEGKLLPKPDSWGMNFINQEHWDTIYGKGKFKIVNNVILRPGFNIEADPMWEILDVDFRYVEGLDLPIAASDIRKALREGIQKGGQFNNYVLASMTKADVQYLFDPQNRPLFYSAVYETGGVLPRSIFTLAPKNMPSERQRQEDVRREFDMRASVALGIPVNFNESRIVPTEDSFRDTNFKGEPDKDEAYVTVFSVTEENGELLGNVRYSVYGRWTGEGESQGVRENLYRLNWIKNPNSTLTAYQESLLQSAIFDYIVKANYLERSAETDLAMLLQQDAFNALKTNSEFLPEALRNLNPQELRAELLNPSRPETRPLLSFDQEINRVSGLLDNLRATPEELRESGVEQGLERELSFWRAVSAYFSAIVNGNENQSAEAPVAALTPDQQPVPDPLDGQARPEDFTKGGIDLNPANLKIEINKENGGVNVEFDPKLLEEIRQQGIEGFIPVIINVQPMESALPLFSQNKNESQLEISHI